MCVALAACGGPLGPIAGGRISGVPHDDLVSDWIFASQFRYAILEVRPSDPYSVTVNYYPVAGRLYLDIGKQAGWHRWRRYIREDPHVRVRFGDRIYRAVAKTVTDPSEIAALLPAYFAKDSRESAPGCSAPFPERCFPETSFVRLDPR